MRREHSVGGRTDCYCVYDWKKIDESLNRSE
jgi:hypothetical protein